MNKINFELKDKEKIDITMGVGIKEIYPPIENLEVTPTKEQQIFTHENSYGYDNVIVEAISDEYIIPEGTLPITENATYDVRNFAKVSTSVYTVPKLQDKEITINENGTHSIKADKEYDGLNQVSVTVDAIEDLTEELEVYNNELTEQEMALETIVQTLKNKGIAEAPKYAPRYISFYNYNGISLEEELSNLDTKNITSMTYMFASCNNLKSLNLSDFNTENVTTMYNMFYNCGLQSLDLSSFDTSNVETMSSMFESCKSQSLNLSSFNTNKAKNFDAMFKNCSKIVTLDLSHFDTTNATRMESTFYGCQLLSSLNVKNWNTQKITNMYACFRGCNKLTSLDLSDFSTPNLTNVGNMFYDCKALTNLDIRNFDFTKVTSYTNMFYNVPTNCEIIVKDETAKTWITSKFTTLTNVKTVAEL